MLNFNRRDGAPEPKDAGKFALKPALYEPPAAGNTGAARPAPAAPAVAPRAEHAAPAPAASTQASAPAASAAPAPAATPDAPRDGSTLSVGINIKLKGVEISDCDHLVIEGLVEATVHSKVMHIEKPGTLTGTALIDVAEVHGVFTGELTARTRLVVHGTGRVSGTIRYGSLVVAEGGQLSGDVKQIENAASASPAASRPATATTEPMARRA
jgi:cytoskeletal protein CcmA (bactofilin family)